MSPSQEVLAILADGEEITPRGGLKDRHADTDQTLKDAGRPTGLARSGSYGVSQHHIQYSLKKRVAHKKVRNILVCVFKGDEYFRAGLRKGNRCVSIAE